MGMKSFSVSEINITDNIPVIEFNVEMIGEYDTEREPLWDFFIHQDNPPNGECKLGLFNIHDSQPVCVFGSKTESLKFLRAYLQNDSFSAKYVYNFLYPDHVERFPQQVVIMDGERLHYFENEKKISTKYNQITKYALDEMKLVLKSIETNTLSKKYPDGTNAKVRDRTSDGTEKNADF
tara:strand:+ start:104 stop:640 length:537 start_codon:yes stop_codon:yes gene_type:complete